MAGRLVCSTILACFICISCFESIAEAKFGGGGGRPGGGSKPGGSWGGSKPGGSKPGGSKPGGGWGGSKPGGGKLGSSGTLKGAVGGFTAGYIAGRIGNRGGYYGGHYYWVGNRHYTGPTSGMITCRVDAPDNMSYNDTKEKITEIIYECKSNEACCDEVCCSSLSGGAIAGIVIGCILGVLICICCCAALARRGKQKKHKSDYSEPAGGHHGYDKPPQPQYGTVGESSGPYGAPGGTAYPPAGDFSHGGGKPPVYPPYPSYQS